MTAQEGTRALEPITRHPGEGEALWFNNDLLVVKATGEETHGGMVVLEELARRGKVTPLHTHPLETESFYLLEGEALFFVDGREIAVGPGAFLSVPPGVPHAYLVTSDTAKALVLITPGSGAMEAFFHDAGQPAAAHALPPEAPLDMERIGAAAGRTGAVEILGPPPFVAP